MALEGAASAAQAASAVASAPTGLAWAWSKVDGNWIDVCAFIFAMLYMTYKWSVAQKIANAKYPFFSKKAGLDLAYGTAFFPLLILGLSIFSSALVNELLHSSRITLGFAGFFALFALIED